MMHTETLSVREAVASLRPARTKSTLLIRPRTGWAALNLPEVWQFRELLLSLAGRDVKLRYKQTALGVSWVVLQPLLAAAIFSFVFGRVAKLDSGGVPYFLFSYCGLLAWNLFSTTLTKSSACLVGNAQLISKVYFPRVILPFSTVPSALIDFAVATAILAVLMPAYHFAPGLPILLLPLWIVLFLLLASGIGLIAAALSVRYRDVQYILPVVTQMLLYASPVAYAIGPVPGRFRFVFMLNPLASMLEAFRWSLLGWKGGTPMPGHLIYAAAVSVGVFVAGMFAFKKMERTFADII
jgi:lipopolysaccharide transport system permease protein